MSIDEIYGGWSKINSCINYIMSSLSNIKCKIRKRNIYAKVQSKDSVFTETHARPEKK
jgi:hypothetical protein